MIPNTCQKLPMTQAQLLQLAKQEADTLYDRLMEIEDHPQPYFEIHPSLFTIARHHLLCLQDAIAQLTEEG